MSKNKTDVRLEDMLKIKPIGENQEKVFKTWDEGKNQFVFGAAGTGKTFVLMYKAFQEVLDLKSKYDKVVVVRSLIPTREIGFLPGDEEDKSALYQIPYRNMVQFMFQQPNEQAFNMLYDRLQNQGSMYFMSTSFLRGMSTFFNAK